MRQNNNGRKIWTESENERRTSWSYKGIVQDKVDNPDSMKQEINRNSLQKLWMEQQISNAF